MKQKSYELPRNLQGKNDKKWKEKYSQQAIKQNDR